MEPFEPSHIQINVHTKEISNLQFVLVLSPTSNSGSSRLERTVGPAFPGKRLCVGGKGSYLHN